MSRLKISYEFSSSLESASHGLGATVDFLHEYPELKEEAGRVTAFPRTRREGTKAVI
jgi:hypothetical protein